MADNIPRFGAADFFITETDPLVLRERLRASLAAVLGRDVVDADPHMVFASAFLPYLVQGSASIDACAKATLRAFARGADLDRIADSTCAVGYLGRRPAEPSVLACVLTAQVKRTAIGTRQDVVLYADLSVAVPDTDGAEYSARLRIPCQFPPTEESIQIIRPAYLRRNVNGAACNGEFADVLTLEMLPDAEIEFSYETPGIEADNAGLFHAGSSYGGSDGETDEDFALRVGWQAKALRVPGSYDYFRLHVDEAAHTLAMCGASVFPHVDDNAKIVFSYVDKAVYIAKRIGLIVDEGYSNSDAFKAAVADMLILTQAARVYSAAVFTNDDSAVRAVYRLPAGLSDYGAATQAVYDAWRVCVASLSWHPGATLDLSEMTGVLTGAGAVGVSVIFTIPASGSIFKLPQDRFLTDSQFWLEYDGIEDPQAPAIGGDWEDVWP